MPGSRSGSPRLADGVTQTSKVLGVFFLAVGLLFALLMLGGVVAGKVAAGMIVLAGSARFLVSGLYELTAASGLQTAAGIVGSSSWRSRRMPASPRSWRTAPDAPSCRSGGRGPARTSFEDGLDAQLNELEHEAGVREQL